MLTAPTEYPAIWGLLLVVNWPVYGFVYRQIFTGRKDAKVSLLSAFKPMVSWKGDDAWSAGKAFSFLLICGLIISFEYEVVGAVLSLALG